VGCGISQAHGTELGVRFRRRVSVNKQGRRQQRFRSQLTLAGQRAHRPAPRKETTLYGTVALSFVIPSEAEGSAVSANLSWKRKYPPNGSNARSKLYGCTVRVTCPVLPRKLLSTPP
jgi:hypothetical protein